MEEGGGVFMNPFFYFYFNDSKIFVFHFSCVFRLYSFHLFMIYAFLFLYFFLLFYSIVFIELFQQFFNQFVTCTVGYLCVHIY